MIYVASRTRHAPMWLRLRDDAHFAISSTWIDEAAPGASADLADLWCRCVREAAECAALVAYIETGDMPLKGAFVEIGAALARGRPVFVVCNADTLGQIGSWVNHPLVTLCYTIHDAMVHATKVALLGGAS